MRQNILDKYGPTAGCPGCVARIKQETVDKDDAIKLETSGNQEEILQELDVSLKRRKIGKPDDNPVGTQAQRRTHPRGENLSKDPVRELRIYWRAALRLSTNFCVTCHLATAKIWKVPGR